MTLGTTDSPDSDFVTQAARNRTDSDCDVLRGAMHLVIDADDKFTVEFRSECLNRMIFFGVDSLRSAVSHLGFHYHTERNHQSLGNWIIDPGEEVDREIGAMYRRDRLGGLLRYNHSAA